ncbi:MAG TPA: flagellar basal body-associated protein FliL [Sulfuricurvum sp.]|nr:flagellar basal body-associated protein FliL [Sulfuricurvum sp.]
MADKEKEVQEESADTTKKSGKLLLIIIIVVLVLILAIGGAIVAMMSGGHEEEAAGGAHQEASSHPDGAKADEAPADEGEHADTGSSLSAVSTEVGIMYPLDLFTVNLLSESGRRYLKVEMNLELEGEELALELDTKKPVLRDIIIRILSSKSLEEISTQKGKESLKEQIVSEINTRIKDGKVKNLYFVDFVVQ